MIERAWAARHNPDAEQAAEGARWALLSGRTWDVPHTGEVLPADVSETLAFIRYTIDRGQQGAAC